LLFRLPEALKIIKDCEQQNITILGLDFWQRRNTAIVEVNSTDYSSISQDSKNTRQEARELLSKGLPGNTDYISFVLQK